MELIIRHNVVYESSFIDGLLQIIVKVAFKNQIILTEQAVATVCCDIAAGAALLAVVLRLHTSPDVAGDKMSNQKIKSNL